MHPLHIRRDAPNKLTIVWDDGHESIFPTGYLREHCPCALCQHEREENESHRLFTLPIARKIELRGLVLSGHNAFIITWGDGHKTGIYTWEYLLALEERMKSPA